MLRFGLLSHKSSPLTREKEKSKTGGGLIRMDEISGATSTQGKQGKKGNEGKKGMRGIR